MKGRATKNTVLAVWLMALATLAQAHQAQDDMSMMGQRGSSSMGMMDGSMMDMMMGHASDMGMMGNSMMGNSMMGGSMMNIGMGRMMQLPDLTDDQREALTNRHRALARQLFGLQQKAMEARFALQDAMSPDAPDPKAVGRALQGVFDVRRQMVEATIAAHNDARAVLTDEQRELLSRRGAGMGMGMSGMRGRMMQRQ